MKRPIPCQCGCNVPTWPNQLTEVVVEYHVVEKGKPKLTRVGRRFMVRPECEEAFKREQNMLAAMRALALQFGEVSWWRRWPHALSLYEAKYHSVVRLQGAQTGRRDAWRAVLVSITPDWLAERLVKRWRPAPPVPATPVPALPCESGPAS